MITLAADKTSRFWEAMRKPFKSLPNILWIAVLLTLPITSLPFLVHLTKGAIVAGASILPLAALALIWYLPWLWRSRRLPREASPLIIFVLIVLIAGLSALFADLHPFKDETLVSRSVEAIATLALGVAFFLITATFVAEEPERLRSSLAWVQVGILVALIWSAVQTSFILCCDSNYPEWIRALHRLISIRDPAVGRVTGFAYEPSWFAHQLNLLYFPLWLASVGLGYSAFRKRLLGLQIEWFFLIGGLAAMVFSTSRIGLAGFLVLAGVMALWFASKVARRLNTSIRARFLTRDRLRSRVSRIGSSLVIWVGFAGIFFVAAYALVLIAGQLDWRWGRILAPAGMRLFSLQYANHLLFAERAVYWAAAYGVFERFPLLGTGLGNSGFLIPETMPAYAWALPEVVDVLRAGTEFFPNPKSLWMRLLAETGIFGFVVFTVWILVMALRAVTLYLRKWQLGRVIGVMGVLAVISLLTEGFSVDSFAFPYLWITLGLVTAAAWTARRAAAVESE